MNMLGEEPPYLCIGTDVSAKYKGAFCEAKVRKVDRLVKCKVAFKLGFGSHTVLDSNVKGTLRVGANIEARHPEKKEFVEGTITKIQDCSQYTVVFDDGDITTLRRSALCLKSGRHFAESETLDQLPLTHPEHFGNPVVAGRRGGRRRIGDESSDGEESHRRGKPKEEREAEIGKVVCVELGDKKKSKDNWFPGLVVAPNAQDTVRIRVKEDYLVRSFKDGRYYTVPKKEATDFTREVGLKVENATLKGAVDKALTFLEKDELPPHWDRELLFGLLDSSDSDSDGGLDSDSSDDEPREEKDHFVAQLYKFMDDRGTPINSCPSVCSRDLDLYKLFKVVHTLNGYNRVTNQNQWKLVSSKIGMGNSPGIVTQVKHAYKRYLHSFEEFYRKLGCTMVNHPRGSRSRSRSGRSLIRDKDRTTPVNVKSEPAFPIKEANPVSEPTPGPAPKKAIVKEEEQKQVAVKVEEEKVKEEKVEKSVAPKELVLEVAEVSSSRKKFPTLKASPRTKEEPTSLGRRTPISRPKRLLRENSIDDDCGKGDQGSTTRAKSKESTAKQLVKKEVIEPRKKSSSKGSDSDGSKRGGKSTASESDKKPKEVKEKIEEVEKRPQSQSGSEDGNVKRTRTRLNTDSSTQDSKSRPCLPRTKSVFTGDIVKVYYGSPNDPNGIYEAKVVDIEEDSSGQQSFLVHYAGWNSRYDEWIKRNKIAENLSWTSRRTKPAADKTTVAKTTSCSSVKKKTVGSKEVPRSTTPSSITSSSSRTKSPATPVPAGKRTSARRAEPSLPLLRRTRRLSGHTDISVDSQYDSESDSIPSDSEPESKKGKVLPERNKKKDLKKVEPKPVLKRRSTKKQLDDSFTTNETTEKKKPRLTKVVTEKTESDKEDSNDYTGDMDNVVSMKEEDKDVDDSPKGCDFDLNEIRSEMKGIGKSIKVVGNQSNVPAESTTDASPEDKVADDKDNELKNCSISDTIISERPENMDTVKSDSEEMAIAETESASCGVPVSSEPLPAVILVAEPVASPIEPEIKEEEADDTPEPIQVLQASVKSVDLNDDIYEFKEPEPFEFQEVRRPIRSFDEIVERSPEKNISVKRVNVATSPMRATGEKKEFNSLEMEMKNRFRKTIGKCLKEMADMLGEEKTEDVPSSPLEIVEEPDRQCSSPPPLIEPSVLEEDVLDNKRESSPVNKSSPEPPCLVPVTDSRVSHHSEHSPVLTREDPPRLDTDDSSSDSESDERLVIANDDESTSNEVKPELKLSPFPDERQVSSEVSMTDTRTKRLDERRKSPPPLVFEPVTSKKTDVCKNEDVDEAEEVLKISEEGESSMRSLVCDEVIPGSPAPRDPVDPPPFSSSSASGAAVVMDNTPPNTPPTTPESNVSSPREDRNGSSLDNESLKSQRDSSDRDIGQEALRGRGSMKYGKRAEKELPESPKKKRRCRKRSESTSETSKRGLVRGRNRARDTGGSDSDDGGKRLGRLSGGRPKVRDLHGSDSDEVGKRGGRMSGSRGTPRDVNDSDSDEGEKRGRGKKAPVDLHQSDSDDSSDTSLPCRVPDPLFNSRSPRPSKYNFMKEIPSDLDPEQRILFIQNQIDELRKAYITVKNQVASYDRRKKKLRRKDREEKAAAAAAAAPGSSIKAPETSMAEKL